MRLRVLISTLVLWAVAASIAPAQNSANPTSPTPPAQEKGAITGTVSDQKGAGIGGAVVKVTRAGGSSQSATTDGQGLYAVSDLLAGTYNVTVTVGSDKIFEANLILSPGQVLTLSVSGPAAAQQSSLGVPPAQGPLTLPGAEAVAASAPAPAASPPQAAPPAQAAPTVTRQTGPGSMAGAVSDQTGAVVVGATVKISNGTSMTEAVTTSATGTYSFKDLPPGSYTLTVNAKGFKDFSADHISVLAGAEVPLDVSLEPAAAVSEVNVTGSKAATVETENAEVSGTITQKEVVKLQLNGRNFTQLIALTPGVSNQTGQDEAKVGVQGSVKYSVNGGRVEYNTFEVDGSDVLNTTLPESQSTLVVYPSLDAISEIKVLTSNYGAEYGRTASGTVLVTTKSGGNAWHGNGYEFFRNEAFNARNYFDQTTKAPLYRRNDFGFTLGGPLYIPGVYNEKKDKTFVFFSEEVRLEKSPSELEPNFNRAVPTLAERQGDFSDVCPNPNDPQDLSKLSGSPLSGRVFFPISLWPDCPRVPPQTIPGFGQLFARQQPDGSFVYNTLINPLGNPQAGLDPNALALLGTNLIPLPNSYGGCNSSLVGQFDHTTGKLIMPCYDAVISEPTHWREELLRLDHTFTSKLQASLTFIHDAWDTTVPTPQWSSENWPKNSFPTVQNRFVGPGISVAARFTQTLSSSLLNVAVVSYSDSHITLSDVNGPGGANFQRPAGLGDPSQVGNCVQSPTSVTSCPMGYIFNNGFGNKAPGIVIAGNNLEYGGAGFTVDPSYMPWDHTNPVFIARDDVSKVIGKHTVQVGVQYVYSQKNETNGALSAASGDVQGLLTFSNVNGGVTNLGNAFANFLYNGGYPSISGGGNAIQSYTQDSTQLKYYNSYQIVEPYVQDDWRINSHFTVNLGVRLSIFGTYHEKYMQEFNWTASAFSPSVAAQLRVDPNTGELFNNPGATPIHLRLGQLDPRITNGLVQCGKNGVPDGCMTNHLLNPAPRVGFAWDPKGDGKTSIRAGYGIFFEHGTGDEANTGSLEGSAPNVLSLTQPFPGGYGCIGLYLPQCNQNVSNTRPGAFPINVTAIPTKAVWPYSQQWSLSVQHQFPHNFVGTVAYVGSKGTDLTMERQLNQLYPVAPALNPFAEHEPILTEIPGAPTGDCTNFGTITSPQFHLQNGVVVSSQNPAFVNLAAACQGESSSAIAVTNTFRPYPGLGQIFALVNGGDSSYHAFQATARRTTGPVTIGVAYSYSHSIDDSSDRSDATFVNSYDPRSNRASSNFDERHLLSVSYVYNLDRILSMAYEWAHERDAADSPSFSNLGRALFKGWEWSGITSFQSGTPFSVINNAGVSGVSVLDNAGVANGAGAGSYPDVIRDPKLIPPPPKDNRQSFGPLLGNPSVFVAPRGLTFGDAGRNVLNNPSRLNFDMALLKHFPLKREGSEIEFRAEAFNILNHTQFRIYNPDLGNTGSNTISCYGGPNYSAGFVIPGGVDCVTGNAFLHPVDAHRPRTMQFALKYNF